MQLSQASMNLSIASLILTTLISSSAAKRYFNSAIYRDKTGVFGRRASYIYENPDEDDEEVEVKTGLKGNSHGRRTEGEIPAPPAFDEIDDDDVAYDPETFFYEARNLDYFKKGIDPELFEWVNPDEIAPGEITCGFLKANLGSLEDINYPIVRVYVCMRFANVQPASKGNLFVHCGGPASLSDCLMPYYLGNPIVLGEKSFNDYNILAIDQVSTTTCINATRVL